MEEECEEDEGEVASGEQGERDAEEKESIPTMLSLQAARTCAP